MAEVEKQGQFHVKAVKTPAEARWENFCPVTKGTKEFSAIKVKEKLKIKRASPFNHANQSNLL